MNAKQAPPKKKFLFRVGIVALKLLALALVLESVFVSIANKLATVLVTGDTGVLSALRHRTAVSYYSYISHNRYLNLWDLKAALIVLGIALYVEALLVELLTKQKPASTGRWALADREKPANREPDVRPG
ncbi:MAG: hypothetical protein E6H00_09300 [Bacillati bacterium ANGP1]|uniref:Uncharacterized protein n=1 Tax=Candidatus Segetimicrobium genomatis TaxID=2569760 RepID=A0A537K1L8_9BACT|nr:MAG: hypothetical protein E6H00_09300 [Terrabacteria group bacterium ANGP1]